MQHTEWKVSKYGGFSCPYFPVFSPNTGKQGPEKTSFFDTSQAVTANQTTAKYDNPRIW